MTFWLGAVVGGIALVCGLAAWRSHRELVAWLGRDELATRRGMRAAMMVATGLLVALAWLKLAHAPQHFSAEGTDVVLLIDVSRSMDARDTAPSRLRRATRLGERLAQEAQGVRLGLVVFAGDAFPAVPLTHDRDALEAYLRALDSELISYPGSDLARGLRVAAEVFDPHSSRSRVLVLLSDGEHAGADLDTAVSQLRRLSVRVAAVGFGTPEGGSVPLPEGSGTEDARAESVISRRADALLRRIADDTNGVYLREREDAPESGDVISPSLLRARAPEASPLPARGLLLLAAVFLGIEVLLSLRWEHRWSSALALGVLTLGVFSCGPRSWIEEGDRLLAAQETRKALSLYRKAERAAGPSTRTSLRIGNAYYRLGEDRRSAGAYLEALRGVDAKDRSTRFIASFNLGNTFLRRGLHAEARDAFWIALREESTSLEAKFNYEWAQERVEEAPLPPGPAAKGRRSGETSGEPSPSAAQTQDATSRAHARPRGAELSRDESQRWLESIEEPLGESLKQGIERGLEGRRIRVRGGQVW